MIAFDAVTEALRAELKANLIADDGVLPQRLAQAIAEIMPLAKDSAHCIGLQRAWLACQLMDDRLQDEEAYSIVAFHPEIKDVRE